MNKIKFKNVLGNPVRSLMIVFLLVWYSIASSEPTLEGPNVIEYKHMIVMDDAEKFIREGARLPSGGCKFIGNATLQKGESKTELELKYDPDTCRSLVEAGTLVSDDYTNSPDQIETQARAIRKTPDSYSIADGTLNSNETKATATARKATLHSWYEDPVGIDLNNVINSVEWHPDG